MDKINTIHDKFIRAILTDKNIAESYFNSYLPAFVSSQLDFSTLTQLPDTYLSKKLQKTMSDIVYSCQKKGIEKEIKICLLIEHKSYPDKYTPVQIGGYIYSALQKQADNKEDLSLVIPILLYHGRGRWKYQTLQSLYKNLEVEWKQFIPDFDYVYNNLGEISDESVEALNNKFLVASLLTLKHSFQKDWLGNNAHRILLLTEQASINLQEILIIYLFNNSKLEEDKIVKLLDSLSLKLKDKVMSTLDIFERKGRLEGAKQTRAEIVRNLITVSVLTDEQIASVAGVTTDFVAKIRVDITAK